MHFQRQHIQWVILSSLTSALTAFNPTSVNVDSEEEMYNAIVKIMGKFPVLVAWTMRKKQGLPLNYGSKIFRLCRKHYENDV